MSAIFIYVTLASDSEAQKIAQALVAERLVACANIHLGTRSLYHWQGKIEERAEVMLLLKTQEKHYRAVEERVKALHSDETPCIVAWPLTAGNADFMQWIIAETNL